MTDQLRASIEKQAEEKYPIDGIVSHVWQVQSERSAYIAGSTEFAEKLEKIREEVSIKASSGVEVSSVNHQIRGQGYREAIKDVLSIIYKHLKE